MHSLPAQRTRLCYICEWKEGKKKRWNKDFPKSQLLMAASQDPISHNQDTAFTNTRASDLRQEVSSQALDHWGKPMVCVL